MEMYLLYVGMNEMIKIINPAYKILEIKTKSFNIKIVTKNEQTKTCYILITRKHSIDTLGEIWFLIFCQEWETYRVNDMN